MKTIFRFALVAVALSSVSVFAAPLGTFEPSAEKIHEVALAKSFSPAVAPAAPAAKADASAKPGASAPTASGAAAAKWDRVAAGTREKQFAVFWAKVYVAELFAQPAAEYRKSSAKEALASLEKMSGVALRLSFLRDLDNAKIHDGFQESMAANKIDPKAPGMAPFFKAIEKAGNAKEHSSLVLMAERAADGSEKISLQNGAAEPQALAVEKGTIQKIFSIWLGEPADSGLKNLQKELLK